MISVTFTGKDTPDTMEILSIYGRNPPFKLDILLFFLENYQTIIK